MPRRPSKDLKSAFIGVRVTEEMRRSLEQISHSERRTLSQVCEFLLGLGLERYKKEGFDLSDKAKV